MKTIPGLSAITDAVLADPGLIDNTPAGEIREGAAKSMAIICADTWKHSGKYGIEMLPAGMACRDTDSPPFRKPVVAAFMSMLMT